MSQTHAATGLTPQQWDDKFFTEYLQQNPFKAYMGTGETSIIQVKEDLTKKKGDTIHFALVSKLTGSANDGTTKLEGSEESMASRSFPLSVALRRNGISVPEMDDQKSAIDLRNAGKAVLKDWAMEQDVARVVAALHSIDGVPYGTASAGQRNTWLVNNSDRVLFGASKSNNTGTMSTSLANVDATNDRPTAAALSLLKRIALTANPKIKPIRVEGGNKRYFVVFTHPLLFRDIKNDPTIVAAQKTVRLEEQNNKLFTGGDIEWDGMIFHEVDDYTLIAGAGASGADVGCLHLCGAQALGMGIAKRWNTREKKEDDYGNEKGLALITIDGLKKMTFGTGANDTDNPKDHGVATGFFAAVADA
jgi:N4-gp56 family major capsid protein